MGSGELSGKVALVTGAGSGIGRATALGLAQHGATVAAVDMRADSVDAVTGTFDAVIERFGRVDILVNNAGIASDETFIDHTMDTWDRIQAVNLRAPFLLIQAFARHVVARGEGGGKIVNLSSSSAFRGERSNPSYGASKAGINALTRTAAAELGPHDINVNSVVPGLTRTPLTEPYIGGADDFQAAVGAGPLANFLRRHSEPEDVASVIVFLCTDAARQVTGQAIHTSAGAVV